MGVVMKQGDWIKLIVAVAGSQSAGVLGALFTMPAITTWYAALTRPDFSPPNWVFGPVWTTLYLLMGVAAFLVWRSGLQEKAVRVGLGFFVAQLFLNSLWSIFFFGLQSPGLAFGEIILLWLMIVMTIRYFAKVSKTAAWLMAPYILWVSFAAYLNYAIWMLN